MLVEDIVILVCEIYRNQPNCDVFLISLSVCIRTDLIEVMNVTCETIQMLLLLIVAMVTSAFFTMYEMQLETVFHHLAKI